MDFRKHYKELTAFIYQDKETVRKGRHQVLNQYLNNFLKSYSNF